MNYKVPYRVYKSPPPTLFLSQINVIRTTKPCFPSILILSYLYLGFPIGLFLSGIPTTILYFCSSHTCYMPRPSRSCESTRDGAPHYVIMEFSSHLYNFYIFRSKCAYEHAGLSSYVIKIPKKQCEFSSRRQYLQFKQ